jgi:hypothetical protein
MNGLLCVTTFVIYVLLCSNIDFHNFNNSILELKKSEKKVQIQLGADDHYLKSIDIPLTSQVSCSPELFNESVIRLESVLSEDIFGLVTLFAINLI